MTRILGLIHDTIEFLISNGLPDGRGRTQLLGGHVANRSTVVFYCDLDHYITPIVEL